MLRASPDRLAALVVASDNFGTRLFRRWEPGGGFTLMGDGASAVVLTGSPGSPGCGRSAG